MLETRESIEGKAYYCVKRDKLLFPTPIDVVCADHFFQKEIVFLEFKLQNL